MDTPPQEGTTVIFRMTIKRNGKVCRRPDGRPWKIVIREPKRRPA